MRFARHGFAFVAMAIALSSSSIARANGRFPTAGQLVVSPSTSSHLVLRTTYGILFSSDSGVTWDWLCEKAVGYGASVEDPSIAITQSDALVVATFEGLAVSPDHGCSWSFAGGALDKQLMTDVAIHPDDASHVLSLVSEFQASTDAGFTYTNEIFASTDNGATWNQLGNALDPSFVAETIDAAKSDSSRIYVSGISGDSANAEGAFYASTNGGQSFTRSLITLLSSDEHAPYIGAVDPTNADRVYVRTSGATSGRLLVTDDGGQNFRTIFSGPPLLGFALSPDGSKVFVGASNGLFEASSTDLNFTQKSSVQVQCLATSGTRIYACSVEESGFILGASDDDGVTFAPLLHLNTLRGPLSCPANTSAEVCLPDWPPLAASLGEVLDGGADASTMGVTPSAKGGCNCDLPSERSSSFGAAAATLAALALLIFRRKRVRPRIRLSR